MKKQVDIFDDVCWVCYYGKPDGQMQRVLGPYYCRNKANEKLITLLSKGFCAWLTYDVGKTQFWRIEEDQSR
tara:strand:+ start:550 stop:765 length:216 start_codon:yes stop_codon:yes gene_type:complete